MSKKLFKGILFAARFIAENPTVRKLPGLGARLLVTIGSLVAKLLWIMVDFPGWCDGWDTHKYDDASDGLPEILPAPSTQHPTPSNTGEELPPLRDCSRIKKDWSSCHHHKRTADSWVCHSHDPAKRKVKGSKGRPTR